MVLSGGKYQMPGVTEAEAEEWMEDILLGLEEWIGLCWPEIKGEGMPSRRNSGGESTEVWQYMQAVIRNAEQSYGARNAARQWG